MLVQVPETRGWGLGPYNRLLNLHGVSADLTAPRRIARCIKRWRNDGRSAQLSTCLVQRMVDMSITFNYPFLQQVCTDGLLWAKLFQGT